MIDSTSVSISINNITFISATADHLGGCGFFFILFLFCKQKPTERACIFLSYQTVFSRNESEYVEKRSRFIATLCHCETEEDANNFVKEMKAKYWDARHNVYAYSVEQGRMCRFSDDGEPHGTAGKPMLDVIVGSGITNIAVVVTRYFGGVLLGTGGLVRAYQKATQEGLSNSVIIEKRLGIALHIQTDYT